MFSYLTEPCDVKFFCLRACAESIGDSDDPPLTGRLAPIIKKGLTRRLGSLYR